MRKVVTAPPRRDPRPRLLQQGDRLVNAARVKVDRDVLEPSQRNADQRPVAGFLLQPRLDRADRVRHLPAAVVIVPQPVEHPRPLPRGARQIERSPVPRSGFVEPPQVEVDRRELDGEVRPQRIQENGALQLLTGLVMFRLPPMVQSQLRVSERISREPLHVFGQSRQRLVIVPQHFVRLRHIQK